MHSGQFVSNFLYDATLMRDTLGQSIAASGCSWSSCRWSSMPRHLVISDWQLALLSLVALPGVAWAMERLGGSMRRAATRNMQETGDLSMVLSEAMDGRRIIKAYGLEEHSADREVRCPIVHAGLATLLKAVRLRAAAAPMTDIFVGIVVALVLFFAGWQNWCTANHLTLNRASPPSLAALLLAQQPVRILESADGPSPRSASPPRNHMFDDHRCWTC